MKIPTTENSYKVKLVYYDLEGNLAIESVWASKEKEYYRIKNIPFFAPNISYDDLISVEDDENELFFDELIEQSGNSTVQIVFFDISTFDNVISKLVDLGCEWEGSHLKNYISVNVPCMVNYHPINSFLLRSRENKILDFKEACLVHQK